MLTALRQSLWVASAGAVVGLAATLLAVKLIGSALYLVPGDAGHEGLLFGVRGTDPYALGGALAVLLSVTLLASAAPARRCARIDPVTSLREE